MDFFQTYNYLAIDHLYLIKYVLQTRLLGMLSFFIKEKVNFRVATSTIPLGYRGGVFYDLTEVYFSMDYTTYNSLKDMYLQ